MQVQAIILILTELADTMQSHYLCWKQSLEEFGVMIKPQLLSYGGSLPFRIAEKFTGSKEQSFIEKVVERKKDLYVDMHREQKCPSILE